MFMKRIDRDILAEISAYYSDKFAQYGTTPRGVDWNGRESQYLRFSQLCKVIHKDHACFSVNDLGCGYGALAEYLATHYESFTYAGYDVSAEMVKTAGKRHSAQANLSFAHAAKPAKKADYTIASGIFNVRQQRAGEEWLAHIISTIELMDEYSLRGFSFNCLTSYSDRNKMRDYLYYADPCRLFDLCKRKHSRQVALLHDYGLYEFTIIVRKE